MSSNDLQAPPIREDGLQIEERRDFQRRFWTAERAAWIVFGVIILLAIAGLTGSGGFLDHGSNKLQTGEIDYPRISRWQTADDFTIVFDRQGETHILTLGQGFLDRFSIQNVSPTPFRSAMTQDGMRMQFDALGGGPHDVRLDVTPTRPGIARYRIDLDGTTAELSTIVLP